MEWFKEIKEYPVSEVICLLEKGPSQEKIQSFCMTREQGTGCPNLVHQSYLEFKPDENFGRHSWKTRKAGSNGR